MEASSRYPPSSAGCHAHGFGGRIEKRTNATAPEEPYLATAIVRPGLVAGVTRQGIDWLRCGPKRFTLLSKTEVALPSALACFPSHVTRELLVVCREGGVVRVPAAE